MSRPVPSTPYLPNAGRANDIWSLNAFDQDLNKALFSILSDIARRVNGSLPADGSEPMTGALTFENNGVPVLTVGGTPAGSELNANGAIELGRLGVSGTPFIDFHSGATATDFDARIIASGGTGVSGGGQLQLAADVVDLAYGHLEFPTTQNPSSDAHTLDDYEEGTWTPALTFGGGNTGITYTTQRGSYIKIGKLIFLDYEVNLSSKGVSTGTALIGGLPFSTASTRPGNGIVGFYANMAFPAGTVGNATLSYGGTDLNIRYHSNTTTTSSNDTHWTNTSRLVGSLTYLAAD